MNKIIDWSENSFNLKSNNDIENGIIALKGGDILNEISVLTTKKIIPISEIINDDYFTDKKIIYVPSKLSYS